MDMSTLKENSTSPELIAPCGIDCRLCRAYTRDKKPCPGCRTDGAFKSKSCVACRIKNCEKLTAGKLEYCFACEAFPCARLVHLDKRYQTKYATTAIGNLLSIKEIGITNFVENENKKWACPACGAMLCMHTPQCLFCGHVWHG